jgi:hypothetical protein
VPDNISTQLTGNIHANAVDLLRVEAGERARILRMLNQLELDLQGQIARNVGKSAITNARLNALLAQTKDTIRTAYGDISDTNIKALGDVSFASAYQVGNAINAAVGVDVASVAFTKGQLTSLANETYFMGRHLEEYWSDAGAKLYSNFTTEMRVGMLQGEGVPELTRRLVGTQANNYSDGIMNRPRYQAEAIVRTATVGAANAGRNATYTDNAELLNGIQWVATLDDRVCEICAALDGLQWELPESGDAEDYGGYIPIDHNQEYPGATAHVSCRCAQIPVMKSYEQLQEENAINEEDAAAIDEDTAASMDGEGSGLGFQEWLDGQSPTLQNDILGEPAAEAYRAGDIKLGDLTNQANRPLTTDQLMAKAGVPVTEETATTSRLLKQDITSVVGNANNGVNTSYEITFADQNKAIYKPVSGESQLMGEKIGGKAAASQAVRDTVSHEVATMIGMDDLVPQTVLREISVAPGAAPELGSVQQFAYDSKTAMHFEGAARYGKIAGDVERSAAYDYMMGNMDRHSNNWMINQTTGKMTLIDNGQVLDGKVTLNSGLFDQAFKEKLLIPSEVKDWLNKWDDIASLLKQRGFQPMEIDNALARLEQLNKYADFKALRINEVPFRE